MVHTIAITLLLSVMTALPVAANQLYRCELLDSANVNEAGRFERQITYERMRETMNPIVVDTATGVVRVGRPAAVWRWRVFQRGSDQMYWYIGRPDEDPQALVVSYLRITPWTSPPVIFLSTSTATFAGRCSVE